MADTVSIQLTDEAMHNILVLARAFFSRPENKGLYERLLEEDEKKQHEKE